MNQIGRAKKVKWRSIPLWIVVKIANSCHPGQEFGNCSKSDVYLTFENGHWNGSSHPDFDRFCKLMDSACAISQASRMELEAKIAHLIKQ